jgi:hypothetical protein
MGDPFDFIAGNLIASAVVELCRARAFMGRHKLCVFERAVVFEICRDAGRPEGMSAYADVHAELSRAALDHSVSVDAVHGFVGQKARAARRRPEEGAFAGLNAGGLDVGIEVGVVRWHFMVLATFLMETHPPALPLW